MTTRPYLVAAASCVAVALFAAPPALAQSKAELKQAKKEFSEGRELYDKKEYVGAAERFEKAYELSGRAELLFNIGQSYRLAEKYELAETYLQRYLAEAADPPNKDEVVQQIVEIQQKLAAEMATVSVETPTPGASVFVDDEAEARCAAPCVTLVKPGERTIYVRADGMAELARPLVLEKGETVTIAERLAPFVVTGKLLVRSDRDATLTVADVTAELPLAEAIVVPVGEQTLALDGGKKARWEGEVTVREGETTELFVPLEGLGRGGSWMKGASYGLFGLGAGAGVASFLLGNQLKATYAELESQQASDGFVNPALVEQGRDQQFATNLMLGVAAGAVVVGVVLFVVDEVVD